MMLWGPTTATIYYPDPLRVESPQPVGTDKSTIVAANSPFVLNGLNAKIVTISIDGTLTVNHEVRIENHAGTLILFEAIPDTDRNVNLTGLSILAVGGFRVNLVLGGTTDKILIEYEMVP